MRHLMLSLVALAMTASATLAKESGGEWTQLFNGKDLTGWTPKIKGCPAGENFGNTFRVEDGLLKVSYDEYDGKFNRRFGHLFFNRPYSNFVLRVEYRFAGDQIEGGPAWARRNNGIMIYGQSPDSMEINQNFPVSIEVQLLGSGQDAPIAFTDYLTAADQNLTVDD